MALDISTFVDITTQVAAGGVPLERFGRGLLITTDDALSAGGPGKVQLYTTLNGFSGDFDASDAMDAASVWFSADPIPQGLWVGRWASVDVATSLRAGAAPTVAAGAAPLNAANAAFAINGVDITVDLSGQATYAAIATALTAPLAAVLTGAVLSFDVDRFLITLADSAAIAPAYLTAPAVGIDISAALGMAQADAPLYRLGSDAESVADAAAAMVGFATSGAPVAIMLADDAPLTDPVAGGDTRENLAAWASAGDYVFFQLDTADQALDPTDMTSVSYLAFNRNQGQVAATYSRAGEKPDVGLAAFQSAQRLDNAASIATAHAKGLPGVAATDITATQYSALSLKRTNIVTNVGGLSSLVGGYTSRPGLLVGCAMVAAVV